jgi:hypothetical protein
MTERPREGQAPPWNPPLLVGTRSYGGQAELPQYKKECRSPFAPPAVYPLYKKSVPLVLALPAVHPLHKKSVPPAVVPRSRYILCTRKVCRPPLPRLFSNTQVKDAAMLLVD